MFKSVDKNLLEIQTYTWMMLLTIVLLHIKWQKMLLWNNLGHLDILRKEKDIIQSRKTNPINLGLGIGRV